MRQSWMADRYNVCSRFGGVHRVPLLCEPCGDPHRVRLDQPRLTPQWHTLDLVRPVAKHLLAQPHRYAGLAFGAVVALLACSTPAVAADEADATNATVSYADLQPPVSRPESTDATPTALPPQAIRYIEGGQKLLDEQRYTEAILELEKALRYDPNNAQVHSLLALACQQSGNEGRAAVHVEKALAAQPDDVVGQYLRGLNALALGRHDEGLVALRTALLCSNAEADHPFTALATYRLAGALFAASYWTAAIEQFEAFERLTTDPPQAYREHAELSRILEVNKGLAALRIGEAYLALGKHAEAAAALGRAAEANASDPALRARYGRSLIRAERVDEAVDVARELIRTFPDAPDGIDLLIQAHEAAGNGAEALRDLEALAARDSDNVALALSLADALLRNDRRSQAVTVLRNVVERDPKAMDAHWKLASILAPEGEVDDVMRVLVRAVAADEQTDVRAEEFVRELAERTEDVRAYLRPFAERVDEARRDHAYGMVLGLLSAAVGQLESAEQAYRAAIEARSDYLPARLALGRIYLDQHRWRQAIEVAEAAERSGGPRHAVQRQLGEAYDGLDEHEKAEEHYKEALRLLRRDTRTLFKLARLYERTGQRLSAEQRYLEVLRIDPGDTRAREALIRSYLNSGEIKNAQIHLDAFAGPATAPHAAGRCRALLAQRIGQSTPGQFREAMVELLSEHGDDAETHIELALALARAAEYEPALEHIRSAQSLGPLSNRGWEVLSSVYRVTLAYDDCDATFRTMLDRHPNRESWLTSYFEFLRARQDFERGIEVLEKLLAVPSATPRRVTYRTWLVLTLLHIGQNDRAVELARTWREGDASDADLRALLVETLNRIGEHDDAVAIARYAYEAAPTDVAARASYVDSLVDAKRFDEALFLVLEWLSDDPDGDGPRDQLLGVLLAGEQHDHAIEWLRSGHTLAAAPAGGIRRDEDLNTSLRLLGLYQNAQRHDDAIALLRKLASEPTLRADIKTRFELELGQQLLTAERFEEAERHFLSLLEQVPEHQTTMRAQIRRLLSAVYQFSGRAQAAEAQLTELFESTEKDSTSYVGLCNDLGYTWADAGKNLDQALAMIRFAVGHSPTSSAYLDSLGWVLYKKGDFEGARTWLTRATRTLSLDMSDPVGQNDDPIILDHLGDALWQLGEQDEALATWRESVKKLEARGSEQRREDRETLKRGRAKIAAAEAGQPPPVAELAP